MTEPTAVGPAVSPQGGVLGAERAPRTARVGPFLGWLGTSYFVLLVICAVAAPLVTPADPVAQDLANRFLPPAWLDGGSWSHLLGTDNLGRDLFSRVIYGSRVSLIISLSAVAVSVLVGTALGLLAGYSAGTGSGLGKVIDRLTLLVTEMALAVPGILLAIAVAAVFGTTIGVLIVVLSLFGWVVYARLVRGIVLSLHSRGFVEAARVLGAGRLKIVLRHMLPHVLGQVLVVASLQVGFMILVETALGYLGLGVRPPTPTWGSMVAEGRVALGASPWIAVTAGMAITITVLSVNFMGELLRMKLVGRTVG